jgi:hypothetical protein
MAHHTARAPVHPKPETVSPAAGRGAGTLPPLRPRAGRDLDALPKPAAAAAGISDHRGRGWERSARDRATRVWELLSVKRWVCRGPWPLMRPACWKQDCPAFWLVRR